MDLAQNNKHISFIHYHNPKLQNDEGNTVALIQAENSQIPERHWRHDPLISNSNGETVALKLSYNGIVPPQIWMHDIKLKDRYCESIEINLRENQLPIPRHWKDGELDQFDLAIYGKIPNFTSFQANQQNEDGFTVAMILALHKYRIPDKWVHRPDIQNNYGQTVFDILVHKKIVPPKEFCMNFDYTNKNGDTQAMILAANGLKVPEYLYHDPNIKNKYGYTVALYMARNGTIPDKQWQHNKYFRVSYSKGYCYQAYLYTVEDFLQQYNIQVPECWKCGFQDEDDNTQAMLQAFQGMIPEEQYNHDSDITNKNGETVAMILASKGLEIPEFWRHDPAKQDRFGNTVAMILASHDYKIPECWYHNPTIKNNQNYTVAHFQAQNKRMPDKQWQHDIYIRTNDIYNCLSVYDFLYGSFINIPKDWKYDFEDNQENTQDMLIAKQGKIPSEIIEQQNEQQNQENNQQNSTPLQLQNSSDNTDDQDNQLYRQLYSSSSQKHIQIQQQQQNKRQRSKSVQIRSYQRERTASLIGSSLNLQLTSNLTGLNLTQSQQSQLVPPAQHSENKTQNKYPTHPPQQQNRDGDTVALILASQGIIPPDYYYHDPTIMNKHCATVATLLAYNGIVPPQKWLQGINLRSEIYQSVYGSLEYLGYVKYKNQYVQNYIYNEETNYCLVCQRQQKTDFVKTKCGHKICLKCFLRLKEANHTRVCPICNNVNWLFGYIGGKTGYKNAILRGWNENPSQHTQGSLLQQCTRLENLEFNEEFNEDEYEDSEDMNDNKWGVWSNKYNIGRRIGIFRKSSYGMVSIKNIGYNENSDESSDDEKYMRYNRDSVGKMKIFDM